MPVREKKSKWPNRVNSGRDVSLRQIVAPREKRSIEGLG